MTTRQGQMLCIISFAVSRFLYLGFLRLRFDESPLTNYPQIVDPQLLKDNLWESLYFLYSQPPGFNLFLGIVLKAFPENHARVFQIVFIGLGLLFALSLFTLMVQLGVSARVSAVLTIIFSNSPTVVLYENWLFYTYPTAALLCLAAVLLHSFATSAKLHTGLAFFSGLILIAYIRAIFHLFWFVFFCLLALYIFREHRKNVALAFCLPLLALGTLYAKNFFVFGSFTSGDLYAAITLKEMTYYKIPEDEHRSLIKQGKLTRMSLLPPSFISNEIESFMDIIGTPEKTGVAVLDQVKNSTGAINYNYVGFHKVTKLISQDNRYFIRQRPDVYLHSVIRAYGYYFLPASDAERFEALKSRNAGIRILDRLYCLVLLGQLRPFFPAAARSGYFPASFLVVGFPVLLAFGFYKGVQANSRKDRATFITLVFLVVNILYVTLVTTLFSDADHNRYRFKLDAFYLTLLGLLISSASAAVKARFHNTKVILMRRPGSSSSDSQPSDNSGGR